ncbi:hypothetical protein K491DRAFT_675759 [Lophiostoma macrostomum CBS 122681]|uniref:Uncharacterized protein n=1 Tax=Lophiostoma macrostomum CBS 122681 TaxID=1314788 RepID=A0A6A6TIQ1_9PLEO|nr:hypothetical protein K491DRAFT_675759 [Lophiostoma macrostomum CBS 122681]
MLFLAVAILVRNQPSIRASHDTKKPGIRNVRQRQRPSNDTEPRDTTCAAASAAQRILPTRLPSTLAADSHERQQTAPPHVRCMTVEGRRMPSMPGGGSVAMRGMTAVVERPTPGLTKGAPALLGNKDIPKYPSSPPLNSTMRASMLLESTTLSNDSPEYKLSP